MTDYSEKKTSAQLEREIGAQRDRVENTINEIQNKLSPGQLVDELLAYAKNSGGGDFVANLGRSVSSNPLPVALMGISLLWLMARPNGSQTSPNYSGDRRWDDGLDSDLGAVYPGDDDEESFEYATISGPVRRLGITESAGARYSEFADDAGKRFRALTDTAGNRAGHFIDDAGSAFGGFRDAAGNRVQDIRDEAGKLFDAASGWASDTWRKAGSAAKSAGDALGDRGARLQHRVADAGGAVQHQADQVSRTLMNVLHDQPLVGGALAFAAGAAIASAFPHTEQEDQMFGEAADKLKQQAGSAANEAYEKGKEGVTELYEQATDKAAEVYQQAKAGVAKSVDQSMGSAS